MTTTMAYEKRNSVKNNENNTRKRGKMAGRKYFSVFVCQILYIVYAMWSPL